MRFHLLKNAFYHIASNYELVSFSRHYKSWNDKLKSIDFNLQVVCTLWLNRKATTANQNHITWNRLRVWNNTISLHLGLTLFIKRAYFQNPVTPLMCKGHKLSREHKITHLPHQLSETPHIKQFCLLAMTCSCSRKHFSYLLLL